MGVAGSDVAVEAAYIALLRDDWSLIPTAIDIARRTMRVARGSASGAISMSSQNASR
jgi:Cd2+/Zn2+-exporting ATPase/Cu+-exporting ATPase